MKIPVMVLCEIDTVKYPDWVDSFPGAVQSALQKSDLVTDTSVSTYRFAPGIEYRDAEDLFNHGKSLRFDYTFVDWYSDEEEV